MMPACDLCAAIKSKEVVLFEDPNSVVLLHPRGAAAGHLLVVPRVHYPIMEHVSDEELRQLFRVTKLMTESLEKGITAKDISIIIANGPAAGQEFPHFAINIVPRGEGDTVKVAWEPMGVAKEDMDDIETKLKTASSEIRAEKKEEPVGEETVTIHGESYQVQRVRRIP